MDDVININDYNWVSPDKYQKYIKGAYNIQMINKIIKNTHYYTTNELVEMVKRSLIKFTNKHPKYNLYIPPFDKVHGKIGSEHFLLLQLETLLHPVEILTRDAPPTNNYPIIIIDDAIYSSFNMCNLIDNYTYDLKCNIKNDFYCIVGVTSNGKPQVCTNLYAREIFYDLCLNHVDAIELFYKDLVDKLPTIMYKEFNCETDNVIPCFFEHKIANNFGTYTELYHNITSINISRDCIDCISENNIIDFINRLKAKMDDVINITDYNWINPEKYQNYIKGSRNRQMINKIIKNTHYYTTNELVEMVKRSLIKFTNKHPKYNLYVPPFEDYGYIGIEHFLLFQLETLLHPIEILTRETLPTNDYPIIFINDAEYDTDSVHIGHYLHSIRNSVVINELYCIVGLTSDNTKNIFYDVCLNNIISTELFSKNLEQFHIMMQEDFKCTETSELMPYFFEHEIKEDFYTYTGLYHNITSINISRECIDCISENNIIDFINKLKN